VPQLTVVGAGPAGLSAACEAAALGLETVVIDEQGQPGGQLVKQIHKFFGSGAHGAGERGYDLGGRLHAEAASAGVRMMARTTVWGVFAEETRRALGLMCDDVIDRMPFERLLIATGASENPLLFPGWTLAGVMNAGAAQTMVNLHRVRPGRRALVVGSGNVGLIVAYQLLQAGIEVVAIVEIMHRVGGWQVHADKVRRMGVPILTGHRVVRATGANGVQEAVVEKLPDQAGGAADQAAGQGSQRSFAVDLVCVAVGLKPRVELARLAGCRLAYEPAIGGITAWHDERMSTSVPGVYVAGDAAGVGEATMAMEEGRLAAIAAARDAGVISAQETDRRRREVSDRLVELRSGPNGDLVSAAKRRLWEGGVFDEQDYWPHSHH
jgi:NADPH-dependent 2,4-dienoyl-CoA reductase/sulfur reductase-like enzyme